MGAVSEAIARAAKQAGAQLRCSTPVHEILVDSNQTAYGVRLQDGSVIRAKRVVSNATTHVTFMRLIENSKIPSQFRRHVEHLDYTSPVCKINVCVPCLHGYPRSKHSVGGRCSNKHACTDCVNASWI
jgi:phytoene dehydrogenase-like protein